jgi:hypothetical protein
MAPQAAAPVAAVVEVPVVEESKIHPIKSSLNFMKTISRSLENTIAKGDVLCD